MEELLPSAKEHRQQVIQSTWTRGGYNGAGSRTFFNQVRRRRALSSWIGRRDPPVTSYSILFYPITLSIANYWFYRSFAKLELVNGRLAIGKRIQRLR